MSATISLHRRVHRTAADLRSMLLDVTVLDRIALAAGALSASSTTDGDTSTTVRTFPVPDAARMFIKGELVLTERRNWDDRSAAVSVTAQELPVLITGNIALRENSDGCDVDVDLVVNVQVPLFGAIAERLVCEQLERTMAAEIDAL